jgi:NodT family efflux transporter outer membrane factor (OMF) lipoprotein
MARECDRLSFPSIFRSGVPRSGVLALAGLTALLLGCTVGPDFTPPPAPDTKSYTEDGTPKLALADAKDTQQHFAMGRKISGDWWELFHSQKLNDVLQLALANNLNLVAAKATLAQAGQAARQAGGALYPQVDLAASASRQRVNLLPVGENVKGPITNLFSIGPTVSYALDIFGANKRTVEKQEALAMYQEWQLDGAYLTLTGNAVAQAIAIASARAQIKAVQSIIADDERNLKLVQSELAAGEATQIDVQSAASQLAADRTLLPPLRQQVSVARHALSVLAGRAPGDWSPPDFDIGEFALPQELPVSLPSELVRQRPDILGAEAQLHAASAAVGVAEAAKYPNITLSAGISQNSLSIGNLFNPTGTVFSLGGQLLAPIFHGGALEAQKQGAVEAFNAALATYQQTVLSSFGQVADVMEALAHDAELLEAERRALQSAESSLQLTRTTYSFGNVGVLQVLDAQRLYEQARLGYVRAQIQRYQDTVLLLTAMGGGWWDWKDRTGPASAEAPGSKQLTAGESQRH